MQATMLQNLLFPGRKERPLQTNPVKAPLIPTIFAGKRLGGGMKLQKKRIKRIITTAPIVAMTPWTEWFLGEEYSGRGNSMTNGSMMGGGSGMGGGGDSTSLTKDSVFPSSTLVFGGSCLTGG
jgi:hypothetical protein